MSANRIACSVVVTALLFVSTAASAQLTEPQINAGLGLLPEQARANAEVLVPEGDGFAVLRSGDNGWSCRIWAQADRLAANCHHRALAAKVDLERRLAAEGHSGSEIRRQMADDMRTGHISIPPGSVEITGSGAMPEGRRVPDVMQGYYFVYFPFGTAESLGVAAEDPGEGKPWLHHAGMVDAHIMWTYSHAAGSR